MDLRRSLEILEIDRTATIDDVNQAYKDIVNVWHPDRFGHNPRLKRKAEEKIKEVNLAYETLKSFYAQKQSQDEGKKRFSSAAGSGAGGSAKARTANQETSHRAKTPNETRDRTEAAFEVGTQLILTAWSYLSSKLRRMVDNQAISREEERKTKDNR